MQAVRIDKLVVFRTNFHLLYQSSVFQVLLMVTTGNSRQERNEGVLA